MTLLHVVRRWSASTVGTFVILLCAALPAWGQVELNVVGTWGGAVNAVFVDEANPDIAYVGSGRRLLILNVADPTNILELGSIDLGTLVFDCKVRGGYAYVCTFAAPNHFCVVDVSDPANPRLVWSSRDNTGAPREVELYGNIAYVRWHSDLLAFNISNPESPQAHGRVLWSDARTIRIVGNLMYVGWDDLPPAFRIYDLSVDPLNPTLLGELPLPSPFWGPLIDIAIEGDLAVVTGEPRRPFSPLGVLDISDPHAPVLVGTSTDFFWPNRVDVTGGFAFVADWMDGSIPSTWRTTKGLAILDVATDPANPALVGTFKTHGTVSAVKVVGERAYVLDEGEGLIILGIADPANPVRLGDWHSPADLRKMFKVGDQLYVTDEWNGVTILDVSQPGRPVLVGVYQTPLDGMGNHWGIEVRNDLAHLSAGWAGVEIVDVSDPANPALRGAFRVPSNVRSAALALDATGEIAHIGLRDNNVQTSFFVNFDVTDPRTISEVGRVEVQGLQHNSYDVRFDGIAFVAAVRNTARVNTLPPTRPTVVGLGPALHAVDNVVDGDLLYVADERSGLLREGGLHILDVSNLADPTELGYFASARASGVALHSSGLVYLVGLFGGERSLLALDVSNPAAPVLVARAPVPGATHLLVDGRHAYVTGGNAGVGLAIVEIAPPTPGDLNCDGRLDGADIDPFFLALGDPPAYALAFPNCDPLNGDMNGDGRLDGGDIDPFFDCLGGGNCP